MRFDLKTGVSTLKSLAPFGTHSRVILLNDSLFQVFSPGESCINLKSIDELVYKLRKEKKTLILLSAPHIYSYIHNTIPLNKKELPRADAQKLGFSRFPDENRTLESFTLAHEKSITIHSHLSENGQTILQELKRKKIKFEWKPALSFFISNLLQYPQTYLRQFKTVTVVFQEEIFQFSWSLASPKIKHLYNWNKSLPLPEKQLSMEKLIGRSMQNETGISVFLDQHSNNPKPIAELFFPTGRKNNIKTVLKKTRKRHQYLSRILSPSLFVFIATVIITTYSFFSHYSLQKLKDKRETVQEEVQHLQMKTGELESLANNERSIAKVESLLNSIDYLQFNPLSFTNRLNELIPSTIWIKTVTLSNEKILLELYDYKNTDLPALVRHFTKEIGSTSLDENSREVLIDKTVRKYTLTILPFKKDEPE